MTIERCIFVSNETVHAVPGFVRVCGHERSAVLVYNDGHVQTAVFPEDVKASAFTYQVNRFNRGARKIRRIVVASK